MGWEFAEEAKSFGELAVHANVLLRAAYVEIQIELIHLDTICRPLLAPEGQP